jgi:hypothetical protein
MGETMSKYTLKHLANHSLVEDLLRLVASERSNTADIIAHLGEVEERRLYAPAGCSSMHSYCVHVLHYSDDSAQKRIRAARAAREFPVLFDCVADGRLSLTAVLRLAAHLTARSVDELVAAASRRTVNEIEDMLAGRTKPGTETQGELCPAADPGVTSPTPPDSDREAIDIACTATAGDDVGTTPAICEPANFQPVSRPVATFFRVTPLSRDVCKVVAHIPRDTHDKLNQFRDLVSHSVPSGDLVEVLDRLLAIGIAQVEKRRFGATDKPRPPRARSAKNKRHIPNHERRIVRERDGNRCTYTSDDGRRCDATRFLQLDHIIALAEGGKSEASNLRQRCHAHNQFAAEERFGPEFMRAKREEARRAGAGSPATATG